MIDDNYINQSFRQTNIYIAS